MGNPEEEMKGGVVFKKRPTPELATKVIDETLRVIPKRTYDDAQQRREQTIGTIADLLLRTNRVIPKDSEFERIFGAA